MRSAAGGDSNAFSCLRKNMKRPFLLLRIPLGIAFCVLVSSCSEKSELAVSLDEAQSKLATLESELEATSQKASSIRNEAEAFENANPDSFRALKMASRTNDRLEAIEIYLNQALIDTDRQLKEMNEANAKSRSMFVKP